MRWSAASALASPTRPLASPLDWRSSPITKRRPKAPPQPHTLSSGQSDRLPRSTPETGCQGENSKTHEAQTRWLGDGRTGQIVGEIDVRKRGAGPKEILVRKPIATRASMPSPLGGKRHSWHDGEPVLRSTRRRERDGEVDRIIEDRTKELIPHKRFIRVPRDGLCK